MNHNSYKKPIIVGLVAASVGAIGLAEWHSLSASCAFENEKLETARYKTLPHVMNILEQRGVVTFGDTIKNGDRVIIDDNLEKLSEGKNMISVWNLFENPAVVSQEEVTIGGKKVSVQVAHMGNNADLLNQGLACSNTHGGEIGVTNRGLHFIQDTNDAEAYLKSVENQKS